MADSFEDKTISETKVVKLKQFNTINTAVDLAFEVIISNIHFKFYFLIFIFRQLNTELRVSKNEMDRSRFSLKH